MQSEFLGDAADFWKRVMLEVIGPKKRLWVAAMVTDEEEWIGEEMTTYASLLGVPKNQIDYKLFNRESRRACFLKRDEHKQRHDYFLDPDTGLATKRQEKKCDAQHVTFAEVKKLLSDNNIVAVYQHRRHEKGGGLRKSARRMHDVHVVGCECSYVGMLFVTQNWTRAQNVRQALADRLGAAADRRIFLKPALRRRPRKSSQHRQAAGAAGPARPMTGRAPSAGSRRRSAGLTLNMRSVYWRSSLALETKAGFLP